MINLDTINKTEAMRYMGLGTSEPVSYTHLDVYKRQVTIVLKVLSPSTHTPNPNISVVFSTIVSWLSSGSQPKIKDTTEKNIGKNYIEHPITLKTIRETYQYMKFNRCV